MEPAPPRAPRSIRIWGWVLLASSLLNLVAFATSLMGTLASGGAPGISSLAVVAFLMTVATGIGFVSGWRWSWYTGLLIAVGGLAFGVWYLQQVRGPGASDIRPALGVIWLGPSLVLLLCLLFPSAIRWMRDGERPWRWPMPPPGTPATTMPPPPIDAAAPKRPSLILPLAIFPGGDRGRLDPLVRPRRRGVPGAGGWAPAHPNDGRRCWHDLRSAGDDVPGPDA